MKKNNNIKRRVIAAVLSAITVISVGTMATTNAFAAETRVTAGTTITNDNKMSFDRDLLQVKNISSSTLLKVLEGATKYGKYACPFISGMLDAFNEKPEERIEKKLTELSDKVDKIFDKLDASEASIKTSISNDLGVQSFYNEFIKFKTVTEGMHKKIKDIYASKLSNADKIAKIASLTGNYTEWRAKFEDVLNELNNFCRKPSMTKQGNIFELTYNHYTQSVMFSGEALDKAKPVCNHVLQVYTAGCATLMESLAAQVCYNKLSNEAKATVNPEFAAHICKDANDIEKEIKTVSVFLTGEQNSKNTDTIKGMYDKLMSTPRNIFVNKGHENTQLATQLKMRNHKSAHADGTYRNYKAKNVANEFNNDMEKKTVTCDKAKALADYAKAKGIAIRKLLENNGINTSNLPKNTNLVTAKAWDGSLSYATGILGYNYQKTYYKGVNIDAKGAGETNVQILDCGYNSWKCSQWGHSIGGNACAMAVK